MLLFICVFVRQCCSVWSVLYMDNTPTCGWVAVCDHWEQMFWTTWCSCSQRALHTLLYTYYAQEKKPTHISIQILYYHFYLISLLWKKTPPICVSPKTFPGVEGEWAPTHEKLPDPCHRGGVLCRGWGQQQEAVQETCRSVHPAWPEEASLHTHCGKTQDTLQETNQDHPQGTLIKWTNTHTPAFRDARQNKWLWLLQEIITGFFSL